jgi:NAD(P)H-dependent flavin oxidoreductase YrpB (nitropropane dioxygenase family)
MSKVLLKKKTLLKSMKDKITIWKEVREQLMRYIQSQMKKLVKENKELQMRLRELMDEHGLEKNFALKALYHSEVAEGGKYQLAYQALDLPKG